jgi:Na+-driven multidrug efflux pump
LFSLLTLLLMRPLLGLLGASADTFDYARRYALCVIVVGAVPTVLSMTMGNLLRNVGCAKQAGLGVSLGGILNILLDPLFMFVILPSGNEVTGAALATMLSNVISLLYFLFVYYKLRGKTILSISPKYARIERRLIAGILVIGLPSALTGMLANISHIIRNNLTSGYGDITTRSWEFRTVGYGHGRETWADIISTLKATGYDGLISIEHEDPLMSPKEGLEKAVAFLKDLIIFESAAEMWWT